MDVAGANCGTVVTSPASGRGDKGKDSYVGNMTFYQPRPGSYPTGSLMELDLGNFVRQRRKANGLTQQELGELAGVGTRFVSELERGKATVRLDVVRKVLAVFGQELGIVQRRRPEDESP